MKFITSNNLTYMLSTLKTKNDALYAPKDHNHEQYLLLTGGLVTGNVQIDGNLVNNNNATFNKQVTFNDIATLGAGANLAGNEVQINADALVNNSVSTHNQAATFNEDATFNKNVTFGEDAVLNGNKVQIDANTLVNNAVSTHNKSATFNGDATFNSPTTFGAGANLAGDEVQINTDTLVNNAVSTHNGAATFNGNATFNSPTTLGAGANLAGNEVQINADALVNNSPSTHNQAATFNNTVVFNKQATFSKDLNVAGNVSVTAETGDAWFNGNISIGADNKQLATEEFVNNRITSLVDSAPDAMNTLNELANAINNHATEYEAYVATVSNALAGKAPASHGTHLSLGTTSSTAYRGDYGNTAYNHSQSAHAPSNAQKNSDITKAEIEAKLTGAITTHTHSYLPLSGGTMTGKITTPNNAQGITIGDDISLCDRNIADHLVLEGSTATNGGITFGSGKDTNIYRGGANLLKTDDTMNAVGGFQWNGQSLDNRYAAKSHGTHLTIGTGASNAAAGNHTHSNYVPNTYLSVDGNQLKYDGNDYQACGSRVLLGDGNAITAGSAISTAIGQTNTVDGSVCVVMGRSNKINGYGNHVLGAENNTYSGYNCVIGDYNTLGKSGSDYSYYGIAIGTSNKIGNTSDTDYATAVGHYNTLNGSYGSAIGYQNTVNGSGCAYGNSCKAESRGSAFGYSAKGYGYYSIALGTYAETGSYDYVNNTASGGNSAVALGYNAKATADFATALGYSAEATNQYATALGYDATASGQYSAALTPYASASGNYSTAIGFSAAATGEHSFSIGTGTSALIGVTAMGHYNTSYGGSTSGTTGTALVIGNGTSSSRSNACRITFAGQVIGKAAYSSSGADYAEYFEWKDGNLNKEDRVGYFVTMDGEKIRIAKEGDYLLGVISGYPAVLGNNDMEWHGYYVLDEFNRPIKKKYTEIKTHEIFNEDHGYSEEELDNMTIEERKKATTKIVEEEIEYEGFVINPDFDPNKEYIHRADRPEWDAVGMMGVLAVYDDGTCEVNGFCKCNNEGIATACERGYDSYRVIKRVNDHIVNIIFK